MKKITLMAFAIVALSMASCKKDFVCECTVTETDPSGDVSTNPVANVTFRDVKHAEAKSLCQNSTVVDVNGSGGTTTTVSNCKLK